MVDPGRVLQREQLLVVLCQVEEVVEGVLVEGGGGGVEDVATAEAEGGGAADAAGGWDGGGQLHAGANGERIVFITPFSIAHC